MLAAMRTIRKPLFLVCFSLLAGTALAAKADLVLENALFRYAISPDAGNKSFVDRTTGADYLRAIRDLRPARRSASAARNSRHCRLAGQGRLTLQFGASGIKAVLKTEVRPSFITLSVESVSGGEIDSLTFLNVPLTLKGAPDEPFGACAFPLT